MAYMVDAINNVNTNMICADSDPQMPQYGERVDGVHYIIRPGAYALLLNEQGRLAVVPSSHGQVLLPGGGIEQGEDTQAALIREVMEEVGLRVEVGEYLGDARQYCYSRKRNKYYNKYCAYYLVKDLGDKPVAAEFELLWLPVNDALNRMGHGSHIWIIEKLIGQANYVWIY